MYEYIRVDGGTASSNNAIEHQVSLKALGAVSAPELAPSTGKAARAVAVRDNPCGKSRSRQGRVPLRPPTQGRISLPRASLPVYLSATFCSSTVRRSCHAPLPPSFPRALALLPSTDVDVAVLGAPLISVAAALFRMPLCGPMMVLGSQVLSQTRDLLQACSSWRCGASRRV